MSMNEPMANPAGPQQPPPAAGMKGSTKVLIGLGAGCGVMVLLCCGGFIGGWMYITNAVSKSISEDPAVVKQVGEQIVKIDLPEEFRPLVSFDASVLVTIAVFEDVASQSQVVLLKPGTMLNKDNEDAVLSPIQQALRQRGKKDESRPLQDARVEQRSIQVNGKATNLTFTRGKDPDSGRPRIQVMGKVAGSAGEAQVMLDMDAEKYPEKRVVQLLESIR